MNLFKISLKNIKKSWKDYSVYFMTLIIGVSIFYMFNALAGQESIKNMSNTGREILTLMSTVIQGMSVAVAVVLGLLMVYANNFLIKRRKKEFGVYRMLGMGKRAVSMIILGETAVIGLISLVIGIVIGVFLSQFLSIIVVKMFQTDVSDYAFTFSTSAVVKTFINFAIIFLVVSIFNTATVAKNELIDLLTAEKKGEKKLIKNKVLSILLVMVSVGMLVVAYGQMAFHAMEFGRNKAALYILMGVVATFLFFIGISGFLLELLQKNKKLYYKGINSFVIRQFCSNINTSAMSMGVICLLLFFTLSAFSVGFSVMNTLNEQVREATPVDVTISHTGGSVSQFYQEQGLEVQQWAKNYVEIPIFCHPQLTMEGIIGSEKERAKKENPYVEWDSYEDVVKLSDYNRVAQIYGWETLKLNDNQYAVLCDFPLMEEILNRSLEKKDLLSIEGQELENIDGKARPQFFMMSSFHSGLGIVVLPDEIIENHMDGFISKGTFFAGNYKTQGRKEAMVTDEKLISLLGDLGEYHYIDGVYHPAVMEVSTKVIVEDANNGLSAFVIFTVLYMGLVFVVSSAAILALKVLSDSIDSVKKYEVLGKIGTEKSMMRMALLKHILLCFGAPLLLAIVHTVFGVLFAKTLLAGMGMEHLLYGVVSTFVIMVLIYGGYMMLTYFGALRVTNIE